MNVERIAAVGSVVVVGAAVVTALLVAGSPAEQRLLRLDEQRVGDLRQLSYAAENRWAELGTLPAAASQLVDGQYLSRLPVDYLKIDRGFVSSIESSDADRAIVAGMVALARALGLKVIAEGVETEAQLARLAELGCDYYQGFRFAPALPAERLEQFAALHGEAIQGTAESGRPRSLRSSRRARRQKIGSESSRFA